MLNMKNGVYIVRGQRVDDPYVSWIQGVYKSLKRANKAMHVAYPKEWEDVQVVPSTNDRCTVTGAHGDQCEYRIECWGVM